MSVIIDSLDVEQLSPVTAAIYGLTPREQWVVEALRLDVHETGAPPPYLRHGRRCQPRRTHRRAVLQPRRVAPVAHPAATLSRRCVTR